MNRRIFLFNQPVVYVNRNVVNLPVNKQKYIESELSEDGSQRVFISRNKKLVMKTLCEDYGVGVNISSLITWQDPISNTTLKNVWREYFILDVDTM